MPLAVEIDAAPERIPAADVAGTYVAAHEHAAVAT
jgi:hypothetical protein